MSGGEGEGKGLRPKVGMLGKGEKGERERERGEIDSGTLTRTSGRALVAIAGAR